MNSNKYLPDTNIIVDEFTGICTILDIDLATTRVYGKIKNELKKKGRPIPENDLWIAATNIQHNLTLVTKDKIVLIYK